LETKTTTNRPSRRQEPGPAITWTLRGRTYVPTTAIRGLGHFDEERARSMTDEGGPAHSERPGS
jgi:hypothetical protein